MLYIICGLMIGYIGWSTRRHLAPTYRRLGDAAEARRLYRIGIAFYIGSAAIIAGGIGQLAR